MGESGVGERSLEPRSVGIRETCVEARNYRYARLLARSLGSSLTQRGGVFSRESTTTHRGSVCGRILSVSEFGWVDALQLVHAKSRCAALHAQTTETATS